MTILGIDIGTTNLKAGLFDLDGSARQIASRAMIAHQAPDGHAYFDPQEVWQQTAAVIQEVVTGATGPIAAIGIASMAETGLLIDRHDGSVRSEMLPWFDMAAQGQADALAAQVDPLEFFIRTGLQVSYKCSLAKLLWLRDRDRAAIENSVWLSAADYIAYCLTHCFATDYSLAGRTCAFDIEQKAWDGAWLQSLGLSTDMFAPADQAGTPVGVTTEEWNPLGLATGIPVAVCGHDHVCGAFVAGAVELGAVFDSMGTAEALIGAMPARPLSETDYDYGLMVGRHVIPDQYYWMGGLSTSGGAVEWLRSQLNPSPLSYPDLMSLLDSASDGPTGILFFPYLLGSGSPHRDSLARGGWIGLKASHTRADLAKAVLEGAAYEMAFVRRVGEQLAGLSTNALTVAGGGTRNRHWLQIKADIFGCTLRKYTQPETTLLGAALLAGIGSSLYADLGEVSAILSEYPVETIHPDSDRQQHYHTLFEEGYVSLQEPLRRFSQLAILQ